MREILDDFKILPHYWRVTILSTLSLRESFLMQSLMMMMSNILFFLFWWIYFLNFSTINGWLINDLSLLYAIVSGSYGIVTVFFGGSRYLARMIYEGDLDALLVKPRSIILQLVTLKSVASGWGDIASSILLLWFSGFCSFFTFFEVLLMIVFSSMVILAFAILLGSLAFWIGNSHQLSKQIFEFLLTFSNYPESIYTGITRIFLFTVIPSAFIGFLPVQLLKEFSLLRVVEMGMFSFGYLFFSFFIFYKGLRRYGSGNRMGFRI